MNQNLTEIIFVIDKSGSMSNLVDDTIGGFNGLINSQKESTDGVAKVTTVLFSSGHSTLHNCVDIRDIPEMTRLQYIPGGMTAMLDAVGDTIESVQNRIDNTPEEERPANVLFAIITDGQENSSHNFSKSKIQKMIEHQTKGHGWEFIFLGANMDAVHEASTMGIASTHSHTYTADTIGTATVYAAVDGAVSSVRACGSVDSGWADSITLASAREYTDSTVASNCAKVSATECGTILS